MADPLSISASAAALITIAMQASSGIQKFYSAYKNQYSAAISTLEKLEDLSTVLDSLSGALRNRKYDEKEKATLQCIESCIQQCEETIQDLSEECKKLETHSNSGLEGAIRSTGRRVMYPLRQSTLQRLEEDIDELREQIAFALDVLQVRSHHKMQDNLTETQNILKAIRSMQISDSLRVWLKAPDPSSDYNAACAKRYPRTGLWLVKGTVFESWLKQMHSFLWINGFAGCGKTVLCSTCIEYVHRHKNGDSRIGIGIFFFKFNDDSKKNELTMLRALLLQFTSQLSNGEDFLIRLRDSFRTAEIPKQTLLDTLRTVLLKFREAYILIDALDESPQFQERYEVLEAIYTIREWKIPGLHMLLTSRDTEDVREALELVTGQEISLRNDSIDQDIRDFVRGQLTTDRQLRHLKKYHELIQDSLCQRANGVFRWVECQFNTLKRCPRSEYHIKMCLQTLPCNLDDTYHRILCAIDDDSVADARRILMLLCFAARPLTVSELVDAIAVNTRDPVGLDRSKRLDDAESLSRICPGLINFVKVESDQLQPFPTSYSLELSQIDSLCLSFWPKGSPVLSAYATDSDFVQIAHFSVQEYLESGRITDPRNQLFALSAVAAHAEIAEICSAYLMTTLLGEQQVTSNYPTGSFRLCFYAAKKWDYHYRLALTAKSLNRALIYSLFENRKYLDLWLTLREDHYFSQLKAELKICKPLCIAVKYGLSEVVARLLSLDRADYETTRATINKKEPQGQTLLILATQSSSSAVVKLLLNAGADVNVPGASGKTALHTSSRLGNEEVVKLLLDAGVKPNTQDKNGRTALHEASVYDHEGVTKMLLDAGVEIDVPDKRHCTPFHYAKLFSDKQAVCTLLLDVGANPSMPDRYEMACWEMESSSWSNELGTHRVYLGVCRRREAMLSRGM